jgi:ATP-dependent helicase/DNAse subunit B
MLVLAGPPGSGKTHAVLAEVRAALGRGSSDFRLIVPTATMAGHLRNELVREGFLLRPGLITTLSRFAGECVDDYRELSFASLSVVVDRVLDRLPPPELEQVAHLAGVRASIAHLIDELASAGCDSHRLREAMNAENFDAPLAAAFQHVYRSVEEELRQLGWPATAARLRLAADEIRSRGLGPITRVFFDGFFTLGELELNLIGAIRLHADVTVVLPAWQGVETVRRQLAALDPDERELPRTLRAPRTVLVAAPTIEREVDEMVRRILEHVEAGRQFRNIGIVLRSRDPYVPVLRAAFERFGIPARFYFSEPLARHSVVRYLCAAVEAMRGGWDHAQTLELLRMTLSGFGNSPACDRFDFAVRARLPGRGLGPLRELCGDMRLAALLDRLAGIESWSAQRALPKTWAERLKCLRCLLETPRASDGVAHETALLWRSRSAALHAFDAALDEAAAMLPENELLPLAALWRAVSIVIAESPLRVEDKRRNVVHVMDAYEARQWELPVVFVCGLLEKQFPLYQSSGPLFSDGACSRMQRAGLPFRTIADRQSEEEFLFEVATTRAVSELVLSYPECNAKGDRNLPSLFLERFPLAPVAARPVRPLSDAVLELAPRDQYLRDPAILDTVRQRHAVLRATSIETFLQCPFQFFLDHTLGIEEAPVRPGDRLGAQLEGSIVHAVLAGFERSSETLEAVFERIFGEACSRARVLPGCRTELSRLRVLRDLRRYIAGKKRLEGWRSFTEQDIRFALEEGVEIAGRIDRYEIGDGHRAVVFDFKYSSENGIRKRIRGHEEERYVQTALYLIGLRESFGCTPAGMFYCGLRGAVNLDGWHVALPGFEKIGVSCREDVFEEKLETARAATMRAAREIRAGRVEPSPADADQCEYCAYRDACRFAAVPQTSSEGAAQ